MTLLCKGKRFISLLLVFCFAVSLFSGLSLETSASVKMGSKGAETRHVQYNLNMLGFSVGNVDSVAGEKTVRAIKDYQNSRGLSADGIAGPATQSALSSEVKEIQTLLKQKGCFSSDIDGVAGPKTISGLKEFQRSAGLAASGVCDGATLEALRAEDEPEESTLSIGSGDYAPGTLEEGESYSFSGVITSNYDITAVTVSVYETNGAALSRLMTASAKPNAKSYDIRALDGDIRFGKLEGGKDYIFRVTAEDASGKREMLVNEPFSVTKPAEPEIGSSISIDPDSCEPGVLEEGESYSLGGRITSARPLTAVTAGIYKANGKAVAETTVSVNSTSYDLRELNKAISFSSLSGSEDGAEYSLRISADDGRVCTLLVNTAFWVVRPPEPVSEPAAASSEASAAPSSKPAASSVPAASTCALSPDVERFEQTSKAVGKFYIVREESTSKGSPLRTEPRSADGNTAAYVHTGDLIYIVEQGYNTSGSLWYKASSVYKASSAVFDAFKNNDGALYLYSERAGEPKTFTLTYHPNGGDGDVKRQERTEGSEVCLTNAFEPSRSGYKFVGWSTDKNDAKPSYSRWASFKMTKDMTLYAVWEKSTYRDDMKALTTSIINGTNSESKIGDSGAKYWSWYEKEKSTRTDSWCATYVSWLLNEVNVSWDESFKWVKTSPPAQRDCLEKYGCYYSKNSGYQPKTGDIVFWNWSNGGEPEDHVGIVVVTSDGTINYLHGNYHSTAVEEGKLKHTIVCYSGGCTLSSRNHSSYLDERVLGYGDMDAYIAATSN